MIGPAISTSFDLSQPAGQILAIVLFLIPGLNCTWIIERLAGRTPLSGPERLLRAISWSLLLYALASPWLIHLDHRVVRGNHLWTWEPIIGISMIEFVAPLVLGVCVVSVRRAEWFTSRLGRLTRIDPSVNSWDFAFSSARRFFVRAKLKTGERVGGLFGSRSYASAYPEPQDLFLEQAWRLTEEGLPDGPVVGSRGLLIRQEDIEVLEFIELEVNGGQSTV